MIVIIVAKVAVVIAVAMLHVAYCTWFERKIIGRMQVRIGPNRTGWQGLLQPIADGVKLFFKEDIIPLAGTGSTRFRFVFKVAPLLMLFATLSSLAVIPVFEAFYIANINVALLYLLGLSAIATYGIIFAGWASDSKYAFLGSLRSAAQLISYEVAMGLSLIGVMILSGSFNFIEIVKAQQHQWYGMYVVPQFLGYFVFMVSAFAETNRTPFDLPEAESELVAGYFVEYSGMRFALFYLGEYVAMIVMSCIAVLCFFGGWELPPIVYKVIPGLQDIPSWAKNMLEAVVFFCKVYLHLFLYYWIRATLPRYRYDQLMGLGWKVLIPLAIVNIVITSVVKFFS
ncbi:MAG TPA: NADH-quinone oxidoreductase subunit NuoH [Dissulfurispiraceae bacterium]|nr:NADH-quinone oxidoreductase subunit NuoH [Dissulfurispiraceae bacterium]